MDATYLLTGHVSPGILTNPDSFYTIHSKSLTWEGDLSKGKWVTNLLKIPRGHLLAQFALNGFYYYFLEREKPVHYYMIDFLIRIAYLEFPEIKAMIDQVPYTEPEVLSLQPMMNEPYDYSRWQIMSVNTTFFKLTYKIPLEAITSSGQKTFWGHLLSDLGSKSS